MDMLLKPQKLSGVVQAPASKSVAHRMLICAAFADGQSKIKINNVSNDILATVKCLEAIGTKIENDGDIWKVTPSKNIPQKATFDCGESGSTLRFMIPIAATLGIESIFDGHGKLPSRPNEPLLDLLKAHGIRIDDGFPIHISGKLENGDFEIRGDVSSQFITGLLLALPLVCGDSTLNVIPPIESAPYIDITADVIKLFGAKTVRTGNKFSIKSGVYSAGDFAVEGDWSNSAFWIAGGVGVSDLNIKSSQGDRNIIEILKKMNAKFVEEQGVIKADVSCLKGCEINAKNIPDLVPILAAVAATADGKTNIINAGRLRIKESDRIKSTVEMINNLGGEAEEKEDGIVIYGKEKLSGGVVNSFNDHRIVMSASIASQKCENEVKIIDAAAVNKSYPEFFVTLNQLGGAADVM